MTAHRYWQLGVICGHGQTYALVAELQFLVAGTVVSTGGTAIGDSNAGGSPPSNAFDANTTTRWYAYMPNLNRNVAFIGYDLGVGVTKDVDQVAIYKASADFLSERVFDAFYIAWSDDGLAWTVQAAYSTPGTDLLTPNAWTMFSTAALPANQVINRSRPSNYQFGYRDPYALSGSAMDASKRNNPCAAGFGGVGRRGSTLLARLTDVSGNFRITGNTTVLGQPALRRVDLIEDKSGLIKEQQFSKADGTFYFEDIAQGPWTVLGFDQNGIQNSVVYAHVLAAAQ